jgi:hypothetical protein
MKACNLNIEELKRNRKETEKKDKVAIEATKLVDANVSRYWQSRDGRWYWQSRF